MICQYICDMAKSVLAEELGDTVKITVGKPSAEPEAGSIYLNVPRISYSRRTFSSDAEDKTQRITVYLNVVYYPSGPTEHSSGRADIFKILGKLRIGSTSHKIESYTSKTNHSHYDITIGYSLPISYFGVNE